MNMGLAASEWQEKNEELHKKSLHDDGCATVFPGGKCNCTQSRERDGRPHPKIPMGGAIREELNV